MPRYRGSCELHGRREIQSSARPNTATGERPRGLVSLSGIKGEDMNECVYPDWEGGHIVGQHKFDKDGFCIFCGTKEKI